MTAPQSILSCASLTAALFDHLLFILSRASSTAFFPLVQIRLNITPYSSPSCILRDPPSPAKMSQLAKAQQGLNIAG
jgi:hypothetical protein